MGDSASDRARHLTARQSLDRFMRSAQDELGTASWWTGVARHLDVLGADLAAEDIDGLIEQVVELAPERAHPAGRIRRLHAQLQEDVLQLRLTVGELAGVPEAAHAVREALAGLLERVSRVCLLADALLLDAYDLDIGTCD
ncbi:MAG: hypothetical protein WCF04_09265 [Candidatus Nanopelagicales bacterium]